MKWAWLLALGACSPMPVVVSPDASVEADASVSFDAGSWTFDVLETRAVAAGTATANVELIRANRPDGARSFILYIHQLVGVDGGAAPVVVTNEPYAAATWTQEPSDARWIARDAGVYPDDEGEGLDGGNGYVEWAPKAVEQQVNDATIFLLNGFAVLAPYGRFYAGGSVEDDVRDATSAFHFALTRTAELDVTRVASYGGSWGGLMTIFGASRAPAGVTLKSVVPLTPPSDLPDMKDWATVRGPPLFVQPDVMRSFYLPYLRRINLAGAGEGTTYTATKICADLRATHASVKVLVPHDEWDTLVPVSETHTLAAACPELIAPIYWPRDGVNPYTALDHAPFALEPGLPTMTTFASLHIALALTPDTQVVLTALFPAALDSYLSLLKAAKARGADTSYAVAPLQMLTEARALCFDGAATPACVQQVSDSFNRVFSATTTTATIRASIATEFGP